MTSTEPTARTREARRVAARLTDGFGTVLLVEQTLEAEDRVPGRLDDDPRGDVAQAIEHDLTAVAPHRLAELAVNVGTLHAPVPEFVTSAADALTYAARLAVRVVLDAIRAERDRDRLAAAVEDPARTCHLCGDTADNGSPFYTDTAGRSWHTACTDRAEDRILAQQDGAL